jgi:histidyl-tRNA synthetase
MSFRAPSGTEDILPDRVPLWLRVEETVRSLFGSYGYRELRPPLLEYTSLFHKSTGEVTDIVEKEMYTFGEGKNALSLRPEVTPSIVRALIEKGLFGQQRFWKTFYLGPAFRRERPQKGRMRQFTQLGVEALGSTDPLLDAEVIRLYAHFLDTLGITRYEIRINSIGCHGCRAGYRDLLRKEITPHIGEYCQNCQTRLERNVFRILDCKGCREKAMKLPLAIDHNCIDCRTHFSLVEKGLEGVSYTVDPHIVRGLDYYTRTVFEFTSDLLGAQDALAGGGRYDSLVKNMGGPDIGAVGFAAGVERLMLVLDALGTNAEGVVPDFYVVAVNDSVRGEVFRIANELRSKGLSGDLDFEGRSLKAQFRSANKLGARYAVVVGPDELSHGNVKLKNMVEKDEREIPVGELESRIVRLER